MHHYKSIGLMSGTSMDGVDIAYCIFTKGDNWNFEIIVAETIPYSDEWKNKLSGLNNSTAYEFAETDAAYGRYLGEIVKAFCNRNNAKPGFVSSHGHTIFHQPEKLFTTQIGSGSQLSSVCGFPVINDFRSADVALGGQGAPLVPVGDIHLFGGYDYCLNLGGIANISFDKNGKRVASDISVCNIALNYLAEKTGKHYDEDGRMAASGKVDADLLEKLNNLPFCHRDFPKSLGREHIERDIFPLLENSIPVNDLLATICSHIATQAGRLVSENNSSMLITGGGAHNKFLVEQIRRQVKATVEIPARTIIDFKEALIFAFLGVLRMRNEINCLSSVTGATRDCCGGVISNSPAEIN